MKSAGLEPGARAADIGCGTGISTRLLAARGLEVAGVDPNAEMLARAALHGGGPAYRKGEAAATGLPDASVELVTAAQSFHWFDLPAALAEFRRILRPGGACAAFWNSRRKDTPFLKAYEELLGAYSAEYRVLKSPASTLAQLKAFPGLKDLREAEFPYAQPMDRAAFLGRVRSSSYVVHGIADRAGFDARLEKLFADHARDGLVEFLYLTKALAWRF